jgi:hypothetical protein
MSSSDGWSDGLPSMVRAVSGVDDRDRSTIRSSVAAGATSMSTPALVFVGLIIVLLSIPLALSLGPLVIGVFLLVLGYRRATDALAGGPAADATFA